MSLNLLDPVKLRKVIPFPVLTTIQGYSKIFFLFNSLTVIKWNKLDRKK